jgi:hypothetical protein
MGHAAAEGSGGLATPQRRRLPAAVPSLDGALLPAREPASQRPLRTRLLRSTKLAAILLVLGAGAASGARDDRHDDGPSDAFGDGRPLERAHRVAGRALEWLGHRVRLESGTIEDDGRSQATPALAARSLALLAFMANGHTAEEGEDNRGVVVRALVRGLLRATTCTPCDCRAVPGEHEVAEFSDPGFNVSDMHGHGYATWALAMAYGMSLGTENVDQREQLRRTLQAAVHVIERAQSERGGWWYHFKASDLHEGSVTVTALQALRAAKEAGMRVDAGVIDKALRYLRDSQVSNASEPNYGGFKYRLGDPLVTFSLTAAAVSSLNQTGVYDSRNVDLGLEYMRQKDPLLHVDQHGSTEMWGPEYGRFYATQAYWQYRELRHFRSWYPQLVAAAEHEQQQDGSFENPAFGTVYATAMEALTLAIPFGYLPSFQR